MTGKLKAHGKNSSDAQYMVVLPMIMRKMDVGARGQDRKCHMMGPGALPFPMKYRLIGAKTGHQILMRVIGIFLAKAISLKATFITKPKLN